MRADKTEVLDIIRSVAREEIKPTYALGTIPATYSSGLPTVVFDGETAAAVKERPHLSSYTPSADDRVLLARVGNGWVILGRVESD